MLNLLVNTKSVLSSDVDNQRWTIGDFLSVWAAASHPPPPHHPLLHFLQYQYAVCAEAEKRLPCLNNVCIMLCIKQVIS